MKKLLEFVKTNKLFSVVLVAFLCILLLVLCGCSKDQPKLDLPEDVPFVGGMYLIDSGVREETDSLGNVETLDVSGYVFPTSQSQNLLSAVSCMGEVTKVDNQYVVECKDTLTPGYDLFLGIYEIVANGTITIFEDMHLEVDVVLESTYFTYGYEYTTTYTLSANLWEFE